MKSVMDQIQYNKNLKKNKKHDCDSISIQMVPLIKRKKSDRWFYKRKRYMILFCVLCFFFLYYQIISFIRLSWDVSDNTESAYLSKNSNKATKEELEFLKGECHFAGSFDDQKFLDSKSIALAVKLSTHFLDLSIANRSSVDLYARRSGGTVESVHQDVRGIPMPGKRREHTVLPDQRPLLRLQGRHRRAIDECVSKQHVSDSLGRSPLARALN